MELKNKISFLIFGLLFYFFVFFLGIISATKFKFPFEKVPKIKALDFLIWFFLLTSFFLFLIYFFKKKKIKRKIFKFFFLISVFFGGIIFFEVWFRKPLSLILIFLFLIWWLKNPNVLNQNLLVSFGICGAAIFLGKMLNPESLIFLLIIFSIYDIFAVYKTKHMIKMAKEMIEQKAIFGIVLPKSFFLFKEKIEKVRPGGNFLILGGGDIAFPLLFSISLIERGIFYSFFVALFSLIGVIFNFFLLFSQKERKPIPALPLISFFSIFGYFLSLLIK